MSQHVIEARSNLPGGAFRSRAGLRVGPTYEIHAVSSEQFAELRADVHISVREVPADRALAAHRKAREDKMKVAQEFEAAAKRALDEAAEIDGVISILEKAAASRPASLPEPTPYTDALRAAQPGFDPSKVKPLAPAPAKHTSR